MTDQARGLVITLLGILFVVPDSLFVRLIDAPALTIAFWRLLLAGGAISLGILVMQGTGPFRAVLRMGRYGAVYMIGTGFSGVLFVMAISLTSVANAVFILASLPIFATIYSRIFLAEPISRRMLVTIAVVLVGIAIIAYGSGETAHASLAGDLLALAVSALFAACTGGIYGAGGGHGLSDRRLPDRAFCPSVRHARITSAVGAGPWRRDCP